MKNVKRLVWAFALCALCANFTACKDDDDDKKEEVKEKRLVQMKKMYADGDETTYDFIYNSTGGSVVVTEYSAEDNSTESRTVNYTIDVNFLLEDRFGDEDVYEGKDGYLLSNGLITADFDATSNYNYNSSNRIIKEEWKNESMEGSYEYTWTEDGRLVKVEGKTLYNMQESVTKTTYEYSGLTTKGYFPLYSYDEGITEYVGLAHPELEGLRSPQLPDKREYYDGDVDSYIYIIYIYIYTFDAEGYVNSVKEIVNGDSESDSVITYTFTWE